MGQGREEQQKITISSEDLMEEILSRLPVKSLLRFNCVCTNWYDLIKSPVFIHKQLQRTIENNNPLLLINGYGSSVQFSDFYTVDLAFPNRAKKLDLPNKWYPKTYHCSVVGSCNGLVCLSFFKAAVTGGHDLCLWNPATRERKFLPRSVLGYTSVCGLSFDPIGNDYKVVTVSYFFDHNKMNKWTDVRVYTLGNDKWTRLGDISYYLYTTSTEVLTTVNGFPHWKGRHVNQSSGDPKLLICFNSARDVFEEIPQPNYTDKSENFITKIAALGGCLSVFCHFSDGQTAIWVMKDYGLKESWTKQFVISREPCFRETMQLGFWSGGKILFDDLSSFYLYDTRSNRREEFKLQGVPIVLSRASYIESLVSPTIPSRRNMKKKMRIETSK